VQVGRAPLDEEAVRDIETCTPDSGFAWVRMRQESPSLRPPSRSSAAGRTPPRRSGRRPEGARPGAKTGRTSDESAASPTGGGGAATASAPEEVETQPLVAAPGRTSQPEGPAPPELEGEHPVVTLMGDQMLERLRGRYRELLGLLEEDVPGLDDATLDEIRLRADGINPDGWSTVEEAVVGIERFDSEIESMIHLLR